MEWNSQRITELTWKFLKDELSPEERKELDVWLSDPYRRARFEERVKAENILDGVMLWGLAKEELPVVGKGDESDMVGAKVLPLGEHTRRGKRWRRWIPAAAVVILIGGAAVWWRISDKQTQKIVPVTVATTTVLPPGGNKAVLILGNGKTVNLDDAANGMVARQQGSDAVKLKNGELAYRNSGVTAPVENTIATPRGGGYKVILPDGSKVWLNAASKIHFPTRFTGPDRIVALEGEACLEVAPDAAHPFIVDAGDTRVRVLGTSFDLMAYKDEGEARTSLATGAVVVIIGTERVDLKPGQQARKVEGKLAVGRCDIDEVLAWKNGYLDFRGADIQTVMRSVSRWWDVDVSFSGPISPERFTGQLNKSLTGEEALKILMASGYHFNRSGKTITVLP